MLGSPLGANSIKTRFYLFGVLICKEYTIYPKIADALVEFDKPVTILSIFTT